MRSTTGTNFGRTCIRRPVRPQLRVGVVRERRVRPHPHGHSRGQAKTHRSEKPLLLEHALPRRNNWACGAHRVLDVERAYSVLQPLSSTLGSPRLLLRPVRQRARRIEQNVR